MTREKANEHPAKAMVYAIIEDAEDISRELFKEKKVDFFVVHCDDCPFEGTYLYFLSKNTAAIISTLLHWKEPYSCGNKQYFCIKIKGSIDEILRKIEKNADLQEIK